MILDAASFKHKPSAIWVTITEPSMLQEQESDVKIIFLSSFGDLEKKEIGANHRFCH